MNQKVLFSAFCLALLILVVRFILVYSNQHPLKNGEVVSLQTTLLSEPQVFSSYQQFITKTNNLQNILIILPSTLSLHYGQTVKIYGSITNKVLSDGKTVATIHFPQIEAEKKQQNWLLSSLNSGLAVIYLLRQKVLELFNSVLPPTASALLIGIVFGIKKNMPSNLTASFKTTGVMHVIAASGMNVTMVGGFLLSFCALFLPRKTSLLVCIGGILFYALFAGFQASIVRASLMFIFALVAQMFGRQYFAYYGLALSAFLMLVTDPTTLFDVGFQLSFASTLGILLIKPLFKSKNLWLEDVSTTISAQIASLPIMLASFGNYGILSILTNALVLWTVPILMVLGGFAAIFGLIVPLLGKLLLYLSLPFLLFFQKIVLWLGAFQLNFTFSLNNFPLIAGYYLLVLGLILLLKKREAKT